MSSPIKAFDGYVYVPDSDPGVFAGAARGMVVRKPDRSPPWIVVEWSATCRSESLPAHKLHHYRISREVFSDTQVTCKRQQP